MVSKDRQLFFLARERALVLHPFVALPLSCRALPVSASYPVELRAEWNISHFSINP